MFLNHASYLAIIMSKRSFSQKPAIEPEEGEEFTEELAGEVAAEPVATEPMKLTVVPRGTIELNKDEIRKRAYNLSMSKKSYDDYVWFWAEQEMKLGKAISAPLTADAKSVIVDAKKIVAKPKESDIRKLAVEFASKKAKVQDIQWLIAERQFICDKALPNLQR